MTAKTEVTHTPGPWTTVTLGHAARRQTQVRDEAGEIVIAVLPYRGTDTANARLIAAAPEMLDMLQNFRSWWADHFEDFDSDTNGELLHLDNEAAAVIAKAGGRVTFDDLHLNDPGEGR